MTTRDDTELLQKDDDFASDGGARVPTWERFVAVGLVILGVVVPLIGLFLAVSSDGKVPFLSANDRSRWATIRSLVEHHTYIIDDVIIRDADATDRKTRFDPNWDSIDKVRHHGPDGREHYYSSKPTLLPTLIAALYAISYYTTGLSLSQSPLLVGRLILILVQVVPFGAMLVAIRIWTLSHGQTSAGRLTVLLISAIGTFLTPFVVSLNNHLPAAVCVVLTIVVLERMLRDHPLARRRLAAVSTWFGYEQSQLHNDARAFDPTTPPRSATGSTFWGWILLAGFFSAFTFANELPALSFLVVVTGLVAVLMPPRQIGLFVLGVAPVVLAMFVTNWIAHGSLRPPYAHRSDGPILAEMPGNWSDRLAAGQLVPEVRAAATERGYHLSPDTLVLPRSAPHHYMIWDREGQDRLALVQRDPDGAMPRLELRVWDDWYDYSGSHWTRPVRPGVDAGEASLAKYAFHLLIGRRGAFSLSPVLILGIIGAVVWVWPRRSASRPYRQPSEAILAAATLALTTVCILFYVFRPLIDRNYGGVTAYPRWLLWLVPLWVMTSSPVIEWLLRSWTGRLVLGALVTISMASALTALTNPWQTPWIDGLLERYGMPL